MTIQLSVYQTKAVQKALDNQADLLEIAAGLEVENGISHDAEELRLEASTLRTILKNSKLNPVVTSCS